MSSKSTSLIRFLISIFTLLSLAIAILSSANANFAVTLRDRARSDYVNTNNGILDNKFQNLQHHILGAAVFTAILTLGLAIYGAVVVIHPKQGLLMAFVAFQTVVALIMIGSGGYLADHVHGFQTSFEKFRANDRIPYYSMIYFGGVAQAAYGTLLISVAIMAVVLVTVLNHYGSKYSLNNATTDVAVPLEDKTEKCQV